MCWFAGWASNVRVKVKVSVSERASGRVGRRGFG